MRNIKKVSIIEVKRCFVTSQLIKQEKGHKRYLGEMSEKEFERRLKVAKVRAVKLTEKELDGFIAKEYKKRLKAYDKAEWYIGEVSTSEVGVWKRAGGLPLAWTNGSLKDTALKVRYALDKNPKLLKKRARHAIPNMLNINVGNLQNEKYLFPIVFLGGTGTNGRRKLKQKMKGDIDDGCMRSVALAVNGIKKIKVYLGYPKTN